MVFTLIQQGLGLRHREKRALCGKMTLRNFYYHSMSTIWHVADLLGLVCYIISRYVHVTVLLVLVWYIIKLSQYVHVTELLVLVFYIISRYLHVTEVLVSVCYITARDGHVDAILNYHWIFANVKYYHINLEKNVLQSHNTEWQCLCQYTRHHYHNDNHT